MIDAWFWSHWVYWLYETHYRWDDDTKVRMRSAESIIWDFSDVDDMIAELELMLRDAKKYKDEILNYDTMWRENTKYQKFIRNILKHAEERKEKSKRIQSKDMNI